MHVNISHPQTVSDHEPPSFQPTHSISDLQNPNSSSPPLPEHLPMNFPIFTWGNLSGPRLGHVVGRMVTISRWLSCHWWLICWHSVLACQGDSSHKFSWPLHKHSPYNSQTCCIYSTPSLTSTYGSRDRFCYIWCILIVSSTL